MGMTRKQRAENAEKKRLALLKRVDDSKVVIVKKDSVEPTHTCEESGVELPDSKAEGTPSRVDSRASGSSKSDEEKQVDSTKESPTVSKNEKGKTTEEIVEPLPDPVKTVEVSKATTEDVKTPVDVEGTTDKVEQKEEKTETKEETAKVSVKTSPPEVPEVPLWVQGMNKLNHTNMVEVEGKDVIINSFKLFRKGRPDGVMKHPRKPKKREKYKTEYDFLTACRLYKTDLRKWKLGYVKLQELLLQLDPVIQKNYHLIGTEVHCWHNGNDKKLKIVGKLSGFNVGKANFGVIVDGYKIDPETKKEVSAKVWKTFRKISTELPLGTTPSVKEVLTPVFDVERKTNSRLKLLVDATSNTGFLLPNGYCEAIHMLQEGADCNLILVWNNHGCQMSFYTVPTDSEGNYRFYGMTADSTGMHLDNTAITMEGRQADILRVFIKAHQESVDAMQVVCIDKANEQEMALFNQIQLNYREERYNELFNEAVVDEGKDDGNEKSSEQQK